jgi:hypothetical protein
VAVSRQRVNTTPKHYVLTSPFFTFNSGPTRVRFTLFTGHEGP